VNRLATETSPYLRQHAENPVPWFPWGPEALELAKAQDKPLFISIGYASCHWCHVMAHESFEDEQTAHDLAASFVSVKVDREERPDIDSVYMQASLVMSGSGGWPLSVFATPDGRPFFVGTYFPPADRHGLPGFRRVISSLAETWQARRSEVERQADEIVQAITHQSRILDHLQAVPEGEGNEHASSFDAVLAGAIAELDARFDEQGAGFGPAPKFPRPTFIELALWHHARTGDLRSLEIATRTLDAMAAGGIYDHLAGGFARYSTDGQWLVPHFEKMLTDQALLARAYLHAWQATQNPAYLQVLTETLDYVDTALAAPGGALFSSHDADAGGIEGAHATFTVAQARTALEAAGIEETLETVRAWYGISEPGNWEGTNVLHRPVGAPLARTAEVEGARVALLAARMQRAQPALDDKVLTEWNAMAAAVFAEAAGATGTQRWARRAESVGAFLFDKLRDPQGRWLRSWQDGTAHHRAFAADHAWLVECCTRLAELTGLRLWRDRAVEVAEALRGGYWEGSGVEDGAGFATTAHDAEALVVRPSDVVDGAVPSANSVGAVALARLGALVGDDRFGAMSRHVVSRTMPLLVNQPLQVADLLAALAWTTHHTEVVVTGGREDLVETVRSFWLPATVLAWGEPDESPLWAERALGSAYVCHDYHCLVPVDDQATLHAQLAPLSAHA
jgi:uncharacterized protein